MKTGLSHALSLVNDVQSYYERLAGMAEGPTAAGGNSSTTRPAPVQPTVPDVLHTAASRKAKPPLPKAKRCVLPPPQEQRVPVESSAQTPMRTSAASAAAVAEAGASAPGSRSAEQSRVSAVAAEDRQLPAASAKQQSRVESKLRTRVEELQVALLTVSPRQCRPVACYKCPPHRGVDPA